MLLTQSDYIRFNLNASKNDELWSTRQAMEKGLSIQLLAWDQTDGMTCGAFDNSANKWPTSMSRRFASGLQLRKGCDGRPGIDLKVDVCGICGGDGKSCLNCDGGIRSGAKIGKLSKNEYSRFSLP